MVARGKNSDGLQKRLHYRFALCSALESRHELAMKRGFGSRSAGEVVTERFLQTVGVDLSGGAACARWDFKWAVLYAAGSRVSKLSPLPFPIPTANASKIPSPR